MSIERPLTENTMNREIISEMVARARKAQAVFETYNQEQVDEICVAIGYSMFKNAEYLGKLEADETGMGNAQDKTFKNRHRIKGSVADIMGKKSVGVLEVNEETGVTKIAKPMGVVGALTPCTNAGAGTVGNAIMICKCRNAVIFAPHPRSKKTSDETVRLIREELKKLDVPLDIVQGISEPTKELTQELMRHVDCVVATGGAAMVKAAYSSGTPAIGVGPGNAVKVVDETADLSETADLIARGKTFDFATSCSSENSMVIQEGVYPALMSELRRQGGYVVSPEEKMALQKAMWVKGALNQNIICKPPKAIAEIAGLTSEEARNAKFFIVPETNTGPEYPFSGEKLSVILAAYKYKEFDEAVDLVRRITGYQGRGHSCGIHSRNEEHIMELAMSVNVCRVVVNQASAFGNSGNFNNGLPFTATLGCGSWGNNSIGENVTYRHLMNITRLARPIQGKTPTDDEIFGAYARKRGD